jgi:hypothetical protein
MLSLRANSLRTLAIVGALGVTVAGTLTAQVARGVVRDSSSRLPIPGAVVIMMDPAGRLGLRTLTNQRGTFAIPVPLPTDRLRIVRLGFRPVEVKVPRGQDDINLDVVMTSIPYSLQPVRVTGGQKCPRRNDRARALALLEQARDGLLATVVARSSTPASMKRLIFDRRHDGTSDRLARHRVQVDTVARTVAAFVAAHSAVDFVADGFTSDSAEEATFHAPDADVLLDDGFANGYCFHIMEPQRERRNQVGLGFRPADRKRGRIDVDGSLWIDTVARALVDIQFKYVGLPVEAERLNPGGRVEFREMPNGVVLIDRWMLRLIGSEPDSTTFPTHEPPASQRARFGVPLTRLVLAESGGELARVAWPDGVAWRGELGKLSLTLVNLDGEPMRNMRVRLDDTNYEATTDSAGHLEIEDLAPGPYSGRIIDPRLEPINLTLPMPLTFVAERGGVTTQRVRAGTLEDFVGDLCRQDKNADVGREPLPGAAWVIGRISDPSGESLSGILATVPYSRKIGAQQPSLKGSYYKTGSDGIFAFCSLKRDDKVEITFGRGTKVLGSISHDTTVPLSVVAVRLEPSRK